VKSDYKRFLKPVRCTGWTDVSWQCMPQWCCCARCAIGAWLYILSWALKCRVNICTSHMFLGGHIDANSYTSVHTSHL